MPKLKILVIADHDRIPRWAMNALDAAEGFEEFHLLSCTNTSNRRRLFKHGAYYALNMVTVRNRMTAGVPVTGGRKKVAGTISFASEYEGIWQRLPDEVLRQIAALKPDLILKFGMNLLRVPDPAALPAPILSYHHGDPDHYRGRPAGFYEMLHGRQAVGQVVQQLSDRLDAGKVLAFGETKVQPHSYRATLTDAFRHSELLINRAIRTALAGGSVSKASNGPNYRLPSNLTVARFILRTAVASLRRLLYGAFYEKHWHVSIAADPGLPQATELPPPGGWQIMPAVPGYRFLADPFFTADPPGLLVEGLSERTGRGEVLYWDERAPPVPVAAGEGHFSYPCPFPGDEGELIVPEIAGWSPPRVYRLRDGRLQEVAPLRVEGEPRILDPTLFEHQERLFLFGSLPSSGGQVLHLWSADSLDAEFRRHPMSPVRVSPRGARMGGQILKAGGELYRLGQNFLSAYGDGLFLFRIDALTERDYSETCLGEIRLRGRRGPHTLNAKDGRIVFDWYHDRFSLLAGVRRLSARLAARKALSGRR